MPLPQLNYKKILILIGFTLASLALAFVVVYFLWLGGPGGDGQPGPIAGVPGGGLPGGGTVQPDGGSFPVTQPGGSGQGQPVTLDSVAQGGPTTVLPVNASRSVSPTLTRGGRDVAYYDPRDGYFYRLSTDGENKTLLTDQKFFNVLSVSWSPQQDRAVLEYPDGSNIIYDFTKRQAVTLPPEAVEPVFSPTADKLAFKIESSNSEENWLVVADSSGAEPKLVEPLGENASQVQVSFSPNEEVVAFYHKPVGTSQEEIFPLGQAGENYKSFVVDGLNFSGRFAPDGTRIVYHVVSPDNQYNPSLWMIDARGPSAGQNKFSLGLTTWIDKCDFGSGGSTLYCAVPEDPAPGLGLSPGALKATQDVFYEINLNTGFSKLIARPATAAGELLVAVTDLWVDESESNLYFWEGRSGQIYRLKLK